MILWDIKWLDIQYEILKQRLYSSKNIIEAKRIIQLMSEIDKRTDEILFKKKKINN